jgi:hypothetical protein
VPIVLKSGSLNLLDPQGLSRPVMGLLYLLLKEIGHQVNAGKTKYVMKVT